MVASRANRPRRRMVASRRVARAPSALSSPSSRSIALSVRRASLRRSSHARVVAVVAIRASRPGAPAPRARLSIDRETIARSTARRSRDRSIDRAIDRSFSRASTLARVSTARRFKPRSIDRSTRADSTERHRATRDGTPRDGTDARGRRRETRADRARTRGGGADARRRRRTDRIGFGFLRRIGVVGPARR